MRGGIALQFTMTETGACFRLSWVVCRALLNSTGLSLFPTVILFFTVPRVGVKDICIQKKELIVCSAEVYYDFFLVLSVY